LPWWCSCAGGAFHLGAHELGSWDDATEVTYRVMYSGPLTLVLAPLLRKTLNAGLLVTLARLSVLAASASLAQILRSRRRPVDFAGVRSSSVCTQYAAGLTRDAGPPLTRWMSLVIRDPPMS
jgi:hypothetical protein